MLNTTLVPESPMYLNATCSALPETRFSPEDIERWTGSPVDFQRDKLGILSRGMLRADESGVSLAAAACRRLFDANPELRPEDVELLIYSTAIQDHGLPNNAALLQSALELPTTCASFDLGLACSGFVYGLAVAKGFMAVEGLRRALLVTCDPFSKIVRREDRDTMAVFGDAATASWLDTDIKHGATIGRGVYGTDGTGAKHLILRSSRPALAGFHPQEQDSGPEDCNLYMNGRAIFNFMLERVRPSMDACLTRNALTVDQVDLFVFHQASRFMVQTLTRHLGLPQDKVPVELMDTGNTGASTIPLVLEKLHAQNRLAGKTVLVCGFGAGLSWAANILTFPGELQ